MVDLATGVDRGPNEEGEIWVRGPQVMKGYLNRPDATAAMLDDDGWLHTGDVGYAEDDGCFFVVDRVKELIKYKGMQIAPAELEALLLEHPAIADAAVVPMPDDAAGQVPKAFVVARGNVTPDEVMAYVAQRVAPFKRLRAVELIDQIPKSPVGQDPEAAAGAAECRGWQRLERSPRPPVYGVARARVIAVRSSGDSGVTSLGKKAITWPFLPTRYLPKFHVGSLPERPRNW